MQTNDPSFKGIYSFNVFAFIFDSMANATEEFKVTLFDMCSQANVVLVSINNETYFLRDSPIEINFNFYSDIDSVVCGSTVFIVSYLDGSPIDSSLFTVDPIGKLYIYSNNYAATGLYSLQVKAY